MCVAEAKMAKPGNRPPVLEVWTRGRTLRDAFPGASASSAQASGASFTTLETSRFPCLRKLPSSESVGWAPTWRVV
jgi:hypothetical protein